MNLSYKNLFYPFTWLPQFIRSFTIYKYYVHKLRKVDYFEYRKLIDERYITPKSFNAVCIYGNYKAIAKLKKTFFNFLTDYVEHGVSFWENPEAVRLLGYIDRPFIKTVYTFGEDRKLLIEKYLKLHRLKRKIVTAGPYIQYVDFFKTESELAAIKQKYGKILLVFPSHSVEGVEVNFSESNFVKEILRIQPDFDTVFICLYWKDALNRDRCRFYEEKGFVVVTAGHRSDPHFLNRLKDLFFLSEQTMSNDIGTHIGYSIVSGKPHYLFNQEKHYLNTTDHKQTDSNTSWPHIRQVFADTFGHYPAPITETQLKLTEKYWGK